MDAADVEARLVELLRAQREAQRLAAVERFTEALNAPGNHGVVVRFESGDEFHLSIVHVRRQAGDEG